MISVSRQPSAATTLLRHLATASKHRALFPVNHPIVQRAMKDLVKIIELLLQDREEVTFEIYADTFFLENQMLPEESLRNAALLSGLVERGVGTFALKREVTPEEVDAFVNLLTSPEAAVRATGGAEQFLRTSGVQHITVGPLRTAPPSSMLVEVDPSNAYQAGHTAAQELRAQASRRQPLDINKARVFLSAAMEVVLQNRFSFMGLMASRDYDEESTYHAVNVAVLALLIGTRLGLQHDQLMALGMGALLHDIGKVRVPQHLLNRASELTPEEQALLKRHPVHGGNILRDLEELGRVGATVALEHHAHYDLSGYPRLQAKTYQHLFSRIVAVADAYDTLTSARSGVQRPLRPELAMKFIAAGLGTIFDPTVGKIFLRMMGIYPVGSVVQLNTGVLAMVLKASEYSVAEPLVRIIRDGQLGELINLAAEPSQWITKGMDPAEVDLDIQALLQEQPAESP